MITEELLQRINQLAGKKRSQGLTAAEQTEQKKLYKIYLAAIREQVTNQLDITGISPKRQQPGNHDKCCANHHHGSGCNDGKY